MTCREGVVIPLMILCNDSGRFFLRVLRAFALNQLSASRPQPTLNALDEWAMIPEMCVAQDEDRSASGCTINQFRQVLVVAPGRPISMVR